MKLLDNPALTLAIALSAGLIAQVIAQHLRLPGLVLLLATGVLLGPDVADVVRPSLLGESLHTLVGFAVAVILFEGGLGLDLRQLRREQLAIRRLVTVGAIVSAVGGALAARFALGFSWRLSMLFGTLIIVTGPTVVTPLLKRLRVKRTVAVILEAEGVLIDAIGAIIAAVALEVALRPSGERLAEGAFEVFATLGFGGLSGVLGGMVIALPLRVRNVVPEGLENVYVLGMVLALFQLSNAFVHESGIAAVIVAGVVVRNAGTHVERELREFKEQLTVMLIGMLFVLLAADMRMAEIRGLGPGWWVVIVALVVVVRPASVLVATWGTTLGFRERAFLAWIAPRGIVAAAVASLVSGELNRAGIEGGHQLRAMVFLLITATVLWSGLTGGPAAWALSLRRKRDEGWVVLSASPIARTLARLLEEGSEEVVCIESDPHAVKQAENEELRVLLGNGLESRTLALAEIEGRAGAIALTTHEQSNILFLQRVKHEARQIRLCAALEPSESGVPEPMLRELGVEILFGQRETLARWNTRLTERSARVRWGRFEHKRNGERAFQHDDQNGPFLPLAIQHKHLVTPVTSTTVPRCGDRVAFLVDDLRPGIAESLLEEYGYRLELSDDEENERKDDEG